jgi:CDP-glucose 4,6-dehydratase
MIRKHQPDFIFHLAAQPIVRRAFVQPYGTVETNVIGSLNVLEAVRCESKKDCIVIMITTDKVYENVGWVHAYRENDTLGGHDPYSASKACAEIIISSYQRSFFSNLQYHADTPAVAVASARGGNAIGGGDWAEHRLIPDCIRHLAEGQAIPIRNKTATRPWQHVLELLSGYLLLGAEIYRAIYLTQPRDLSRLIALCSPFNFGPFVTSNQSVEALVQTILTYWPGEWKDLSLPTMQHEAGRLHLAIDKAYHLIGWKPQWSFEESVQHTVDWYREYYIEARETPQCVQALTQHQIKAYAALIA